ncbi:MAG: HAD family phosphatase [Atopobiaceae bacterium]|jgi:HAD superfamily hydrolase (TIGR01509 family)|nr:HAD family phosphatase [Atopobiaceae bacterium]
MDHPRCCLFDFDGVCADTEPLGVEWDREAFRAVGVEPSLDEMLALVGTNGPDSVPRVLARHHAEATFEQYQAAKDAITSVYERPELVAMPGVVDFVGGLRERGIATGLVSTTRSSYILFALNNLGMASLFDTIVCGDMVERHKPDPLCYERSLANLGISARDAIAFEDSPTGIAAAKAAGLYVVGFEGSVIEQDTSAADTTLGSFVGASIERVLS